MGNPERVDLKVSIYFSVSKTLDGLTEFKIIVTPSLGKECIFTGVAGKVQASNKFSKCLPRYSQIFSLNSQTVDGIDWDSYGCSLHLNKDGHLTVSSYNKFDIPNISLKGLSKHSVISIHGYNYANLTLSARRVNLVDTLQAKQLKVYADAINNSKQIRCLNTVLRFSNKSGPSLLGFIYSDEVILINPPEISQVCAIVARKSVSLINKKRAIKMPGLKLYTPELNIYAPDFELPAQTACGRTILHVDLGKDMLLQNNYHTDGTFSLQELNTNQSNIAQAIHNRFGDVANYNLNTLPKPQYKISIEATIFAKKGISSFTPHAKISLGNNNTLKMGALLSPEGRLSIFATLFDCEYARANAISALIFAPASFTVGRFALDQFRRVLSTFHSNEYVGTCHSLGNHIIQTGYELHGANELISANEQVYDGLHLLNMPFIGTNGTLLYFKDNLEVVGAVTMYAKIVTNDCSIISVGKSSIKAGELHIKGDAKFSGKFELETVTSTFKYNYFSTLGWNAAGGLNFNCSEPAIVRINGTLSGDCTIDNHASILFAGNKSPEVHITSKAFTSSMRQLVVSGTTERIRRLVSIDVQHPELNQHCVTFLSGHCDANRVNHPLWNTYGKQVFNSVLPSKITFAGWNGYADNGALPAAFNFLLKTDNFINSRVVYPALLTVNSATVLEISNGELDSVLNIPELLILQDGSVSVVIRNQSYVHDPDVITDFVHVPINLNTVYIPDNITELMQNAAKQKFYFGMQPVFGFDDDADNEFYQQIIDDIVVVGLDGKINNVRAPVKFALSPELLLEIVTRQCEKDLYSTSLYPVKTIDRNMLQDLHRNMRKYLQKHYTLGAGLVNSLAINSSHAAHNSDISEPVIYYKEYINEHGTKELHAQFYIPASWKHARRQEVGVGNRFNVLAVLPKSETAKDYLQLLNKQPLQQAVLQKLLHDNPIIAKALETNVLTHAIVADQGANKLSIKGGALAEYMILVGAGDVEINGELISKNMLIMNLAGDIVIKSLIERFYNGNTANFDDQVIAQARLHAYEVLMIVSAKDVIFNSAQTQSGILTHIEAVANILDLPVTLVHQSVHKIISDTLSGFVKDVYVEQVGSSHKVSNGPINMFAGQNVCLVSTSADAKKLNVVAVDGGASFASANEFREHEEQLNSKSHSALRGTKTINSSESSTATSSKPPIFNVGELDIYAKKGIVLENIISKATLNVLRCPDGEVSFILGRNIIQSAKRESASDLWWNRNDAVTISQNTFSTSQIDGKIVITANRIMLEQVRGIVLPFISQIEHNAQYMSFSTVDEYVNVEVKSKSGPGAATLALTAVIATVATQGLCSGWAASVANTMVIAGFSSLCSQAAVSLVANDGNPAAALKALLSTSAVKSCATSMITAGVMHNAASALNLPDFEVRSLQEHAIYNVARAAVTMTLDVSVNNRDLDQAICNALVDAAISTVSATLVTKAEIMNADDSKAMNAIKLSVVQTSMAMTQGAILGGSDEAILGALRGLSTTLLGYMYQEITTADGTGYSAGDEAKGRKAKGAKDKDSESKRSEAKVAAKKKVVSTVTIEGKGVSKSEVVDLVHSDALSLFPESKTNEQFISNYGLKPTKINMLWLYATNKLLPNDRKLVGNAIGDGIVTGTKRGEEQIFGRVRQAKDSIVNYFVAGQRAQERWGGGRQPDITSMYYASPLLARTGLSLVPDTHTDVVIYAAIAVGAEPMAASVMWLYNSTKVGRTMKSINPPYAKFGQPLVNERGIITDSVRKSGGKWLTEPYAQGNKANLAYRGEQFSNFGKNASSSSHPQSNFIQGLKQRVEYSLQEKSILDSAGKLTDFAKQNSIRIIRGEELADARVIAELTKNGSPMKDWGKYSITVKGEVTLDRSIQQLLKDGPKFVEKTTKNIEVHYYMNHKTGEACYLNGFKVKGDISLLPKDGNANVLKVDL